MSISQHNKGLVSGKHDVIAIGIFFLYCSAFAMSRLLISSTMELDEAEQFLLASVFQWGYPSQPPLYSWIIHIISSLLGLNIFTLIITKYSMLFLFFSAFYLTARSFWEADKSLAVTGSLMLFPLFAYEFNRDLSHSILVTLMAVLTCLVYIRMLTRRNAFSYSVIGVCIAFGILSKYNFVLFLFALVAASLSTKEGRRLLFDRRILISVFVCLAVLLPHVIWLIQDDFSPFHHAMRKAEAGSLFDSSPVRVLFTILSPYAGPVLFFIVFLFFFGRFISPRVRRKSAGGEILSLAALYGLIAPLLAVIIFGTAHFAERWLAPVLFLIPLSCFLMVNLDEQGRRLKVFGRLGASVALIVLLVRIFVGSMPDLIGKVEHIHIPFHELSRQLSGTLFQRHNSYHAGITIVTDDAHIAANVMAWIPGMRFVHLRQVRQSAAKGENIPSQNVMILWDAVKLGKEMPEKFLRYYPSASVMLFESPYLYATKHPSFVLGVGIVP
jgi:4-amino-4-deoxy-L-arabinose transferase-like glycosyltransferase